jgi:hypothetical protein
VADPHPVIATPAPNPFKIVPLISYQLSVISGKWEVGQLSVISYQLSVISGKWEVGSGKWEVGSGKWEVGKWEE